MFSSLPDDRGRRLLCLALGIVILSTTIRTGPGPATGTGTAISASPVAGEAEGDEHWYEPVPEDFRPHYDRDTANLAKQTWDQYWKWVKVFYEGNFLSDGWTERSKDLLTVVASDGDRNKLRAMINAVGRELGAEWSKDNAVRTVNSTDLLAWGRMLETAKARDDGTGGEIRRTIEALRAVFRKERDRRDPSGPLR